MLSDAWVVRSVVGIDDDGEPVAGTDEDVREFDNTEFECSDCGESLSWSEVEVEEADEASDADQDTQTS